MNQSRTLSEFTREHNMLSGRPRLINIMHAAHLRPAESSTTKQELACLARHAAGKRVAIEIGTHMGVSAVVIARALAPDGLLYCIDPWPRKGNRENPSWLICDRELNRNHVAHKVRYVRLVSTEARASIPNDADFIFVDGDHSQRGIATDWQIVQEKLAVGGIACFHDTSVAPGTHHRLESVDYFRDVIARDTSFTHLETCETLNVIRRVS